MARRKFVTKFELEHARFIFSPNIEGRAERYNAAGNRYFNVRIEDEDLLERLLEEGWNIKYTKPRDEEDTPEAYLRVKVGFDPTRPERDPDIYIVRGRTIKMKLNGNNAKMVDSADIADMSMTIRPWVRTNDDGTMGITAYLDEMFVELEGSRFADRYDFDEFASRTNDETEEIPFD